MTKASAYDPNRPQELARLATQAQHLEVFDRQLISAAAARTATQTRGLIAVDLGCANGALTVSRFSGNRFAHVLGVDRDPELVASATALAAGDPRFTFVTLDLESGDVEGEIRHWLESRRVGRLVDVMFSALTMHHLADPVGVLRNARLVTADPGALIVRSADDGSKLAWPDPDGDLSRILELTAAAAGASDRSHGRKLTDQLWGAGYRNIAVEQHTLSTFGRTPAGRSALFADSLSWRVEYLARAARADSAGAAPLAEMIERLGNLERRFADHGFWYSETAYAAVASA